MTGTDVATTESAENHGPAMSALTEKQQAFVLELVRGSRPEKPSLAAAAAGYADPSVSAHQLMRSRKVLAAIREEADKRFGASALIGVKALVDIANDPMHKQRFQAAQALLDRAGLQVVAKQEIVVKDDRIQAMTIEQLMTELRDSAKRLGLVKPEDFAQNVIDGEFTEVDPFIIQPGEFVDGHAEHLHGADGPSAEPLRHDLPDAGTGVQLRNGERSDGDGS